MPLRGGLEVNRSLAGEGVANDLKTFLKAGQGRVSVTLSLPDDTAISRVGTAAQEQTAYTPGGRKAESTAKGITVRKGKKFINRR